MKLLEGMMKKSNDKDITIVQLQNRVFSKKKELMIWHIKVRQIVLFCEI